MGSTQPLDQVYWDIDKLVKSPVFETGIFLGSKPSVPAILVLVNLKRVVESL